MCKYNAIFLKIFAYSKKKMYLCSRFCEKAFVSLEQIGRASCLEKPDKKEKSPQKTA